MRNRYIISITDLKGTRSINVHKMIKKVIIYSVIILATILLVGVVTIDFLISELSSLESKKNMIAEEYSKMLQKNDQLFNEMQLKKDELVLLTDKLEDLEGVVGVNHEGHGELSLEERVDLASVTGTQKGFVLQLIPSGWPLKEQEVSSNYGSRTHPILKRVEYHPGIDLRAGHGTPVFATADGIVDYTITGNNGGYGNTVVIDHVFGFNTIFGHLSKIVVEKGTFVKKGDIIAYSGNTGLSSGPHLHYEVRFLSQHLNPKPFLDWDMANFEKIFKQERVVKWQSLLNMISRMGTLQTPQLSQAEQESKELSR